MTTIKQIMDNNKLSIKALRKINQISIDEMADKLEITKYEYKAIEERKTKITRRDLYALAYLFNINSSQIDLSNKN